MHCIRRTILKWNVAPGGHVPSGEVLYEVRAEKLTEAGATVDMLVEARGRPVACIRLFLPALCSEKVVFSCVVLFRNCRLKYLQFSLKNLQLYIQFGRVQKIYRDNIPGEGRHVGHSMICFRRIVLMGMEGLMLCQKGKRWAVSSQHH